MAFIYVAEQGAVLQKSGGRLVVRKDEKKLADLPVGKIDGVLIFGNVQFTTQALGLLMKNAVEMAVFSGRGKLLGQMTSPYPKNIALRMAQYEKMRDQDFVLNFSRDMVDAKLTNALSFMREFAHNHPDTDIAGQMDEISRLKDTLPEKTSVASLLGVEGAAASAYFKGFARMIRRGFGFEGRKKHPSPDPVNSLLSFGYTLVYNEISWLLDGMGFDPFMGFFHRPHYGHATLASDLIEQFRSPLVDRFTLSLINNRVLTPEDFFLHTRSGGMYLKNEAKKRYFAQYERFMARPPILSADSKNEGFRALFFRRAEGLKKTVETGEPYVPYRFEW